MASRTPDRRTDTKTCSSCGRTMSWRKAWEKNWDEIKYCSDACRSRRVSARDKQLEALLMEKLIAGPRGALVNPVDVIPMASTTSGTNPGANPRAPVQAEDVRRAARRLVAAGDAEIVQNGRVVDPSTAVGPFMVRRRQ